MLALDPRDPDPGRREALLAWLAVQRAFALQPQAVPREALETTRGWPDLRVLGVSPPGPELGRRWLRQLSSAGARIVPLASPLYPDRLARLRDAPPVLALRGNPGLLRARCVAVVGARAATVYGRGVAEELGRRLAAAGLVVVSGLARGVDAAAHEGALQGGATLAFQACGPDRVYPPEHRRLADRIAAGGAVVSELPLGAPPRRQHFPLRNRLIAGLSEAVVVVEARDRSGSLITARHAAEQGADVYAVPGPITAPTSRGPHRLLRDGAIPLTSPEDLLQDLGVSGAAPGAASAPAEASQASAPSDPLARAVLEALGSQPLDRDELGRRLETTPAALGAALSMLELSGFVNEDRDGRLYRTSPAARSRL